MIKKKQIKLLKIQTNCQSQNEKKYLYFQNMNQVLESLEFVLTLLNFIDFDDTLPQNISTDL